MFHIFKYILFYSKLNKIGLLDLDTNTNCLKCKKCKNNKLVLYNVNKLLDFNCRYLLLPIIVGR